MSSVAFIIVFTILIVAQIVLLGSMVYGGNTAIAGDVSKRAFRRQWTSKPVHKQLIINDDKIDLSEFVSLIVHGNSMRQYRIKDGQRVYVYEFKTEADRKGISTRPVVVFKIKHTLPWFSQYKLRKFVSYLEDVDTLDWNNVFEDNKDKIQIPKVQFVKEIQTKLKKVDNKKGLFVLSETYDEHTEGCRYSLHHASNLYGAVKYAI